METFRFEHEDYLVDYALQWIGDIIFAPIQKETVDEMYLCEYHKSLQQTRKLAECYINVKEDEIEEEEDPRNINVQESKGYRPLQGPKLNLVAPY